MAHRGGHNLRELRTILRLAWRKFAHSRTYKRVITSLGVVHVLHTLEATLGKKDGWHPHIHVLLLTGPGNPSADVKRDGLVALGAEWRAAVVKALAASQVPESRWSQFLPGIKRGVSLTESVGAGDYIVKFGLSVGPNTSASPNSGRSASEVMLSAAAGDAGDRARWQEYTHAMHGQHLVHGLGKVLKALGMEARPATFPSRRRTVVAVMPEPLYRRLARADGAIPRVLYGAVERGLRGVAISVAADVYGVIARDPKRLPVKVHELIRLFNPAGPYAHPSTWLPGGAGGGPTLRQLRRTRKIVLSLARGRRSRRSRWSPDDSAAATA
jgi:hypothetical protein